MLDWLIKAAHMCMCALTLVCVCLFACVRCCISNYGLQKPIMIVLLRCDAQDHSLHRKYFVIDVYVCLCVCVYGRKREREKEKQMIRMKGSCGMRGCVPHVCGVCVCDTGGAMATNFLPQEVINAPAWLWLCLFLSSNDCHTAIMASEKPRNNSRIMAEAIAALHRFNSHIGELCVGVSQQHLCFHKQGWKGFTVKGWAAALEAKEQA